jgi:hypothetical protein
MTQHAQKIEAQRYEENLSTPNYSSAFWLRPAANSIAARILPLSRSFGTDPASSEPTPLLLLFFLKSIKMNTFSVFCFAKWYSFYYLCTNIKYKNESISS